MSIQTTETIPRTVAIFRIEKIAKIVQDGNWHELDECCFEPDIDAVSNFMSKDISILTRERLEKMSIKQLESLMDEPFFRTSMFVNYEITE